MDLFELKIDHGNEEPEWFGTYPTREDALRDAARDLYSALESDLNPSNLALENEFDRETIVSVGKKLLALLDRGEYEKALEISRDYPARSPMYIENIGELTQNVAKPTRAEFPGLSALGY